MVGIKKEAKGPGGLLGLPNSRAVLVNAQSGTRI